MTTASLVLPFAALLDDGVVAAFCRRAVQVGRGVGYAASSVAMAAFLWLLLAGPGFMTDHASTSASRGHILAQR